MFELGKYSQYVSESKTFGFNCSIVQLPKIFALRSLQWSIVLWKIG